MKKLDLRDAENLVLGCSIYGCGGGGNPRYGLKLLREGIKQGLEFRLASLSDLNPHYSLVSAYFCGPIGNPCPGAPERKVSGELRAQAVKVYEKATSDRVAGIYPVELGGSNTPLAWRIAAELGLPLLDADAAGRAVPELAQNSLRVKGRELYPAVLIDALGDIVVLERYSSIEMYESLARYLTTKSCGSVFIVDGGVAAQAVSELLIGGTVSRCIEVGEKYREIVLSDTPEDASRKLAELLGGFYLTSGKVAAAELKVEGGFLQGYYILDASLGRAKVYVKNENIAMWIEDKPAVLPPDLIIMIGDDGYPVLDSWLEEGMKLHVIAAPAHPIWRTEGGLKLLGPQHFGFKERYIPLEALVERLSI
ncbi:MAG: DUF917 domain-containing protein [Thermoprotei archaeon]|nr:MAG: DUF917 domain-containing protein [Thermoprotei archaeon]